MTEPFGYELLLDLYRCSKGVADDLDLCYFFLETAVRVLGVKAQSPPFLFRTDETHYADKAGLSGWIPLVESGIQLHTLTVKHFISIDIYSCRKFGPLKITEFARSCFLPTRIEAQTVLRGVRYHEQQVGKRPTHGSDL